MTKPVIEIKNVTKMYGHSRGVLDLSLEVPKGSVFGFLGPNGAGKTTTISMLIDLIHPTKGEIKIFGLDSQRDSLKIRSKIGFLGGDMTLDETLTGYQQLEYFGSLRGLYDKKYVEELGKRFSCELNRKIRTLSRGNKQKIGLISALMHRPELLILDEPTSGLDPLIQDQFNQLIIEHRAAGKTVFISSHILSEVEQLCDHVAFIREGKLIANKPIDDITIGLAKHVKIVTGDSHVQEGIAKIHGISQLKSKDRTLTALFNGEINELIEYLSKHKINDFSVTAPDLDTIFTKYYGE